MASFSLRTPAIQYHEGIIKFASLKKPSRIPYNTGISIWRKWQKSQLLLSINSVSESSVSTGKDVVEDPTAELRYLDPETDADSISEWELDFCSRPILDIRGKKVWELVVCDESLSLQYTNYFPNNVINSVTLKDAIASISDELGIPLPDKIRFFR